MTIDNLAPGNALPVKLARNRMVVNVPAHNVAGVEDRSSIDYYLEVYVPQFPGSTEYILLETLDAKDSPKVTDGAIETYNGAFFEIDDLLRSFLKSSAPDFGQTNIKSLPYMTTNYYCKVVIKVDDVEVSTETLEPGIAIYSGISERDWSDYQDVFFTDFIGVERRFLTYKPVDTIIAADQPEILHWLHNYSDTISELNLKVVATTAAGSEISGIALTLSNVTALRVYSIPVGVSVLSTIHNEKAQVVKYTLWLTDENGERVSEVRSYTIDKVYRRNNRYLYFLNSLGVYECLRLTGTGSEELDLQSTEAEQFTGYDYLAKYAERVITDKAGSRKLMVNLQWSKKSVVKHLTDLALSHSYYFVSDRDLWPMLLKGDRYVPSDDNEDWAGREFLFEFTNMEHFYSDLPVVVPKETRPTMWAPLAASCEIDSRGRYNGLRIVTMLELVYADDGSQVLPRKIKPNVANEEGYVAPVISDQCELADTPYLSDEIQAYGSFSKSNCGAGTVGGPAQITVVEDAWGSTVSLQDANAKAQAEWDSLDTQAYADANGTCSAPNTNGLRAKFWNFVSALSGFGPNWNFGAAPAHQEVVTNADSNVFATTYPNAASAGVVNDKMVMELNGYLKAQATAADLQLVANVDDGIRIYVGGVLVLDSWKYDSGTSKDKVSQTIAVTANEFYSLKIQLYNQDGFFGNTLSWKWTGQAKTGVPDAQLFYI
ncbi:DUF5977 domain-containing protein [Jiulongibacter sp. NS-SX5]|uniref:DUF5977 domain-containing protein n=1 Tax=Jiulongibacter sp. NS-SX5 TaxID=3463854 RepID=UPI00405A014E